MAYGRRSTYRRRSTGSSTRRRSTGYGRSRSSYRSRRRQTARQQTVKIVLEHRQQSAPPAELFGMKPAPGPRKSSL
jgi:hypothetical protein